MGFRTRNRARAQDERKRANESRKEWAKRTNRKLSRRRPGQ